MRYLQVDEILINHIQIIEQANGRHGVRDVSLLGSLAKKPQLTLIGRGEIYDTIFLKAAAYLESFAKGQVFVDGNKRSSFATAGLFLKMNGYTLEVPFDEAARFCVSTVEEDFSIIEIAHWLEKYSVANK